VAIGNSIASCLFPARGCDELSQLRSCTLRPLIPGEATAEFFLLFGPGPTKLEDVAFINGSDKLKTAADSLCDVDFKLHPPP
jgi:hypothetical protein